MDRIFHTWEKWECYPSGLYGTRPPKGMTPAECEEAYRDLLSDEDRFRKICKLIISEWKNSCEHYLTNEKMNRIAWMGQAATAYDLGIPAQYRTGYNLLNEQQQKRADLIALEAINEWMVINGNDTYTIETISSKTAANIY